MFVRHVEAVRQHSRELQQASRKVPLDQIQLLLEHVEALGTALEELHVAEEELRQQNEELVEARQILEAERQRYQELFEFAPDGYLVTDIYGTVREANHVASKLLNLDVRYLIGKPLSSFVPEEDRRAFRSMLSQLPTVNRVQEWEVQLQGRKTGLFEAALTIETVRDGQGTAVMLRWLLRDITARKQAELQLRQTQLENLRLVEADRLKNQFFRNISHELRTPLNAIVGFSNLLLLQFHHQVAPRGIHMLERILVNGNHLLALIEDLLDFSRLQSNRVELHLESFDLAELAAQVVEQLHSLADQKQLELYLCLDSPSVLVINDPVRVRQVLINLLSNAIKFTPQGSVWLEIEELGEDRVALSVHDTGAGIALEDQERIFQEFWQLDQTLTRQQGGAGLGLSITHALVRLMKGTISVKSQIGEGSVFRVELPRWSLFASFPSSSPFQ